MVRGHVKKRDGGHMSRRMFNATVAGKKRRGRQKIRCKDSRKRDMKSVALKEVDAPERTKWENDIQYHSGDPR